MRVYDEFDTIDIDKEKFFSDWLSTFNLLNREKYKGRGRPRKGDYITLFGTQKRINTIYNQYLENSITSESINIKPGGGTASQQAKVILGEEGNPRIRPLRKTA